MSRRKQLQQLFQRLLQFVFVAALLGAASYGVFGPASADELGNRSLDLSNATAGTTSIYQLSFDIASPGPVGSISLTLCSNDPFPQDPCSIPNGSDLSNAVLTAQTGETGFSIASGSAPNVLVLTRPAVAASAGRVTYTLANVMNPSDNGSYFARIQTYASTDGTGPATDNGGIVFYINSELSVSAEVPPYLIFCTGITIDGYNCANAQGNYIDFGEFSATRANQGSSQMLTVTNSNSGYSITMDGTTLTSGNNILEPLTSNDVSRPGTSQFGINLRANSSPIGGSDPTGPGVGQPAATYDQPNFYRFVPGEIVASATQPDNVREYTVSYIANIPSDQAPGIYVTTVTYVCLATF
jgi:hypothetical protein